jgi:hypothetical protein
MALPIAWDPLAKRLSDSDKADGHLGRERRTGFELPEA